jgi:hypothetical protein
MDFCLDGAVVLVSHMKKVTDVPESLDADMPKLLATKRRQSRNLLYGQFIGVWLDL